MQARREKTGRERKRGKEKKKKKRRKKRERVESPRAANTAAKLTGKQDRSTARVGGFNPELVRLRRRSAPVSLVRTLCESYRLAPLPLPPPPPQRSLSLFSRSIRLVRVYTRSPVSFSLSPHREIPRRRRFRRPTIRHSRSYLLILVSVFLSFRPPRLL